MIGNATRGSGFRGLLSYLMNEKDSRRGRVLWTASRNLPVDDPELVPTFMRAVADRSLSCQKPVYHLSISLDRGETLDRETFLKVADQTLEDLGLSGHQAFLVAHGDTRHAHLHIMVNRVPLEPGPAWAGRRDYGRIQKSLRPQERALGLREVPGRFFQLEGQKVPERGRRPAGHRKAELEGRRPFAEAVRAVVGQDLLEARSWAELHRRLAEVGLWAHPRGRGLVITDGERYAKASSIDRRASRGQLEARLGLFILPVGKARHRVSFRELESFRRTVAELAARQGGEGLRTMSRARRAYHLKVLAARGDARRRLDPEAHLALLASEQVRKIGWRMAARVLPVGQFQLLRQALRLGRGLMSASLDRGRL